MKIASSIRPLACPHAKQFKRFHFILAWTKSNHLYVCFQSNNVPVLKSLEEGFNLTIQAQLLNITILQSNPAISNSVNSKSPLFRTKIEFPWIYPYVSSQLLSAISNSVISNSPLFRTDRSFPTP